MLGIMPLLCQSIGLWCANRVIVRGEGKDLPTFVECEPMRHLRTAIGTFAE